MTELEKYEAVNKCETFEELANMIESFADEDGMIQERVNKFDATEMAKLCRDYPNYPRNVLTREFGIRQQAMYIEYYTI
jgi:hypothetical protein